MSYVVEIKRTGESPALTADDFEVLLEGDPTLVLSDGRLIVWNQEQEAKSLQINIESDHLWTDGVRGHDQEIYLEKLREIARFLDARVIGEEGEDLTEGFSDNTTLRGHSVSTVAGFFLFAIMIPVLIIAFLVRLPWMILKLSRTLKSH